MFDSLRNITDNTAPKDPTKETQKEEANLR